MLDTAIAGLGLTEMGKIYGRSAADFAAEALAIALDDAGLAKDDVDGLLVNANFAPDMSPLLQAKLGLRDLRLLNVMDSFGASVGAMLQYASLAIDAGLANAVALIYADAPLVRAESGASYSAPARKDVGMDGLPAAYGWAGPNSEYAMAAQRHMHLYGTTSDQLGAIAVSQREWALMNPVAQMRKPMTLEDYHASRWIAEPFHLFDCCLVSNGAVAMVVTSADRARTLRQPPIYVLAAEQGSPGDDGRTDREPHIHTGAALSGPLALERAGVTLADVDMCQIYDAYTFSVLVTLEDYGFCAKGEGGAFVQDGRTGPGGSMPTNTGGGQLSGYYMWGMTPLSEAVIQLRGQAGERQLDKHDVAMVSGNGGTLDFHTTVVLGVDQP